MSLGLLASVTISMFAFGGTLVLLRQLQGSRFWFLVATTAFVVGGIIVQNAAQFLTLPFAAPISATAFREEFPGLILSVMALMAVFYMQRLIEERKGLENERAELERELSQAQKLESLGTLAGGIAHEINSPAQFVRDNTWFLQTAFSDLSVVLQKHKELLEAATASGVLTDAVAEANAAAEVADMHYIVEEIPAVIEQSLAASNKSPRSGSRQHQHKNNRKEDREATNGSEFKLVNPVEGVSPPFAGYASLR